jgi:hypothetical protein
LKPLRAAALVLASTWAAAPPGDDGAAEIAAGAFSIRFPEPLRPRGEEAASMAPGLAAEVARELRLPALGAATVLLVGSRLRPGDPLFDEAAGVPAWAAGQALASSSTIIVRVDRLGGYGRRRLRSVLAHEIAHLTVAASLPRRGQEMPAWLREGIASTVAHEWEWRDPFLVWTSPLPSSPSPFASLEAAHARGEPSWETAYAGSLAAVGFLERGYGGGFPARLLEGLRGGAGFEDAFVRAAGVTVDEAERAWREDLRRPSVWVVRIASSVTLWTTLTLLILVAYAVKRRRSRETLQRWRHEEGPDVWGDGPPETIH